jgi:CRP-like cAMP-binding protein
MINVLLTCFRGIALFDRLEPHQRDRLARYTTSTHHVIHDAEPPLAVSNRAATLRSLKEDQIVYAYGEPSDAVYVVLSGAVSGNTLHSSFCN